MQRINYQNIFICLDDKCTEDQKVITSAGDMFQHKSHNIPKRFTEIFSDLENHKKVVDEFISHHDLNQQYAQIDDQQELILTDFRTQLNEFIQYVKSELKSRFIQTQRLKDILQSIKTFNLDVLQQLQGDFSFLVKIIELPNLSKQIEQPNRQIISDMAEMKIKINQLWTNPDLNLKRRNSIIIQTNKSEAMFQAKNFLRPKYEENKSQEGLKQNGSKYRYENGNVYQGEWQNNKRNGEGMMLFANGAKYNGSFKEDQKDGYGELYYSNGNVYKGQWQNDNRNGNGEIIFANGDKFKGNQKQGKYDGYGEYYEANGNVYKGQWLNDNKSGQGEFIWTNGEKYRGSFRENKIDGNGEYLFAYEKKM